jgi:hypothetical protein
MLEVEAILKNERERASCDIATLDDVAGVRRCLCGYFIGMKA